MLHWINWIVLLSLEPLAGELKYASVVWSAAAGHGHGHGQGHGQVGSPMSSNGGQHWGFYWRLPSLLLLRLHMPKSVQCCLMLCYQFQTSRYHFGPSMLVVV
jgi:hypothetical protein